MLPINRPLARASARLRAGQPVPGRLARLHPATSGLSYYERHRASILARLRAAYRTDPTKQRAAVRASLARRDRRILQMGFRLASGLR